MGDESLVDLWEVWLKVREEWLNAREREEFDLFNKEWTEEEFDRSNQEWTEEEIARFDLEIDDADDSFDPLDEEVRMNLLKEERYSKD